MLAYVVTGSVTVYVLTFATTTGIVRPIAGTLVLAAIGHAFVWVHRRRATAPPTVPAPGLYLALVSLLIGAVLGVLLGIFIAHGSIPERVGRWRAAREDRVLLAVTARGLPWDRLELAVVWAVNLSLLGFLLGLIAESTVLKQVSTPILGAALLAAIATPLTRARSVPSPA